MSSWMSDDITFPRNEIGERDTTRIYFKIKNIGRGDISLMIYECKKKKNVCPYKVEMLLDEALWFMDFLKSEHLKGSYKNTNPAYIFFLPIGKEGREVSVEKRNDVLHINVHDYCDKRLNFIWLYKKELDQLVRSSKEIIDKMTKLASLFERNIENKHCIISY